MSISNNSTLEAFIVKRRKVLLPVLDKKFLPSLQPGWINSTREITPNGNFHYRGEYITDDDDEIQWLENTDKIDAMQRVRDLESLILMNLIKTLPIV